MHRNTPSSGNHVGGSHQSSASAPSPLPTSTSGASLSSLNISSAPPADEKPKRRYLSSIKLMVLLILCLQNSLFTVLRRYSQGVLKESYSKHEVLLVGEVVKMVYAAYMIQSSLPFDQSIQQRLTYLVQTSRKMAILALIYGAMNILSFVALRNISAGLFTILAQLKIATTAISSSVILRRSYSWTQWRALSTLLLGVLLFSEPIWGNADNFTRQEGANQLLGTLAVLTEVSLSGFASIYFEKVIKLDPLQLSIWERNFQLALTSFPVYLGFIAWDLISTDDPQQHLFHGWSWMAVILSMLGAAGGLLVALSIKHGDSILKTLATTGAIILSSVLDHIFLGGPLTPTMMIAGGQVIVSICNYTFDATPKVSQPPPSSTSSTKIDGKENDLLLQEEGAATPLLKPSGSRQSDHNE